MNKKNENPFKGTVIDAKHPHAQRDFTLDGVLFRATLNSTNAAGRLSRGTIAILDAQTGYLMQRDPDSKTHRFEDAIHRSLIVPLPNAGQRQEDIIWQTVERAARKLARENAARLRAEWHRTDSLGALTLHQALDVYMTDYLTDRTSSGKLRVTYQNRLMSLAACLSERQIKDIRRVDLKRFCEQHCAENRAAYIEELDRFLKDTAHRLGMRVPTDAAEKYLTSLAVGSSNAERKQMQRTAANADILPIRYEHKLDQMAWEHMGEPLWGATMLIKEGGLATEVICGLRIADIECTDNSEGKVFILYRRDGLASATQDYTFPLSPCGGMYIAKYIQLLRTQDDARSTEERYLFSSDMEGNIPLESTEVNAFIRKQLSGFLFGYAGQISLNEGLTISMGASLLRATREKHLREDCGLSGDSGALNFLLHRSMTNQVQANHYRAFTDETGREYLWRALQRDRHGLPEALEDAEKPKRVSRAARENYDELRFPPQELYGDMLLIVHLSGELKEGDKIEVIAQEGCFLDAGNP